MKVLVLSLILLAFCVGCSSAAQVTLVWIQPCFNEDINCGVATDSLKDLQSNQIFAQASGRTDSILVATINAVGRECRTDSVSVNRSKGRWNFWMYVFDSIGNRSCRSNVVVKDVVGKPGASSIR